MTTHLPERIAREHPNYATGNMIDGAECSTCRAQIEAVSGRVDVGWNVHIAEVMEAAVREQVAMKLWAAADISAQKSEQSGLTVRAVERHALIATIYARAAAMVVPT